MIFANGIKNGIVTFWVQFIEYLLFNISKNCHFNRMSTEHWIHTNHDMNELNPSLFRFHFKNKNLCPYKHHKLKSFDRFVLFITQNNHWKKGKLWSAPRSIAKLNNICYQNNNIRNNRDAVNRQPPEHIWVYEPLTTLAYLQSNNSHRLHVVFCLLSDNWWYQSKKNSMYLSLSITNTCSIIVLLSKTANNSRCTYNALIKYTQYTIKVRIVGCKAPLNEKRLHSYTCTFHSILFVIIVWSFVGNRLRW